MQTQTVYTKIAKN